MDELLPRARKAVADLARFGGEPLGEGDWTLLERRADSEIDDRDKPRYAELGQAFIKGFFVAAQRGHEFIPRDVVQAERGQTIAENYPEASPEFLRFANSYWTLKYLADEMRLHDAFLGLTATLSGLERQVGPIFFPFPGPIQIPASQREADQRRLLEALAPGIDIDAFIRGNPILRRDRMAEKSGCLGAILALGGVGTWLAGLA